MMVCAPREENTEKICDNCSVLIKKGQWLGKYIGDGGVLFIIHYFLNNPKRAETLVFAP